MAVWNDMFQKCSINLCINILGDKIQCISKYTAYYAKC